MSKKLANYKNTKATNPTRRSYSAKSWTPDIDADLKALMDSQDKPSDDLVIASTEDLQEADGPLVRLVNSVIHEAIERKASDIHIEPFEEIVRIRFRIDGVLHEVQKVPTKLASAIVSRIKIMANLDICERRIPQDGVIRYRKDDTGGDLRVSTLPSTHGENVVMRVLGCTNLNNDLSNLGMVASQLKIFRDAIRKPNGLVLVTGPTGSGKTTTLYGALNELNDISVSVFTAEDPVEGTLPGVTQCQVNNAVGYTFSAMLRSFLRQDPDVILVGEIRDLETAEIAIKASLTGHLVLSTLHTNCSVSTIQRLLNIGIAPYLITSALNCIVAQRLVRRICPHCKAKREASSSMLDSLGLSSLSLKGIELAFGKGCEACHGSGFLGRAAVYEILVLNDELRTLILKGASKAQLKHAARLQGLTTLRDSGLQLVKQGVTTIEEVLGRTAEDEEFNEEHENVKASSQGVKGKTEEDYLSSVPAEELEGPLSLQ